MAINEVVNVSGSLLMEIGKIGLWAKAAGIAAFIWLVVQIVSIWFDFKRFRQIIAIKGDMKRIESKLDRVLKGKK